MRKEIDKAKQMCNEEELHTQEAITFCKSFLKNMDKASQVKPVAYAIEKIFESDQFWHNEHTKLLKYKGSGSSKSSSMRTSSSSASSKASVKLKESLLKLCQDTTKAELFVEQAEEQAKKKLDLIRKRQVLDEAETLNTLVEAKEQLKVAEILETLIYDDSALINNDSVKPKLFTDITRHRSNLYPNSPKFYVPSNRNLIHKPQCTYPNNEHVRPSTSYYIPRNLNN